MPDENAAIGRAHIRHGLGAARPYLHGHLDLEDFVKQVFGAIEVERAEMGPKSFHIESRIGDSVVVLETGDPPHPSATVDSVYVYVEDVDALAVTPGAGVPCRSRPAPNGGLSAHCLEHWRLR